MDCLSPDKLANDVENAANVIATLKSNSESIGGVLDVIQGIAEQTNLLALEAITAAISTINLMNTQIASGAEKT